MKITSTSPVQLLLVASVKSVIPHQSPSSLQLTCTVNYNIVAKADDIKMIK